jgi:hypothetical protein
MPSDLTVSSVASALRHAADRRLAPSTDRFAENGISVAALPHLTDQAFKDIGVLLGHRRILLAAIGELAGAPTATPEPAVETKPKPQEAAERRQVTVMFFGPCRLDGHVRPHGPRGFAGSHFGLSEVRSRDRAPLRRVRS